MSRTVEELGDAINRMMFTVEVYRNGTWSLIGRYFAKYHAEYIADEYRARGETVRVTYE